jgi:hypothetical protein
MRILIITHPRSGGTILGKWLSEELGYNFINEPDYKESNDNIKIDSFSQNNTVVKIFPYKLTQNKIDMLSFIKTYDKIICHMRSSPLDVAISLTHGILTKNFNSSYIIDNEFLETNLSLIIEQIEVVKNFYYLDVKKYINLNSLCTTYDDVYKTKKDLNNIKEFIGLDELKFTYMMDVDNKYSKSNLNLEIIKKNPKIMQFSGIEKFIKTLI